MAIVEPNAPAGEAINVKLERTRVNATKPITFPIETRRRFHYGKGWPTNAADNWRNRKSSKMSDRTRKPQTLSPKSVKLHPSAEAQHAFGDLAAAVHFSDHFDGLILSVVDDLAGGKALSVEDFVTALPVIVEETFRHIHATGDDKAAKAWRAIAEGFSEHGLTLTSNRRSERGHSL